VVATLILAALYARERMRPRDPVSFSILPPRGYVNDFASIAPDGSAMAFAARNESGESSIWLRRVGSVVPSKLIESAAMQPAEIFWSPDGKWLGFFDHDNLMKMPAQGGTPETICAGCVSYGEGATWGSSGTIVFCPRFGEGLLRVPASGGKVERVTTLDAKRRESLNGWPQFVGDSDRFVYLSGTIADEKNAIYGGSLGGNTTTFLTNADSLVGVWKKYLLFVRDGVLYGQHFDASKMLLSGEPRKIVEDVYFNQDVAHSYATVARNGALSYPPASNTEWKVQVGWYDRGGRMVEKLFDDVNLDDLALPPDDSRVAMMKWAPKKGAYDIYIYDIVRGVRSKMTGGLANHERITWSRAGDRVLFSSDGDGMYNIYAQTDDGMTPPQLIWKDDDDKHPMDISPDGRLLLASRQTPKAKKDIWLVPLTGDAKPSPLIATEAREESASFSPDGKWIVYASEQSGRAEVYVRSFPNGRSVQVSVDGGDVPHWSPDGSEIYFTTRDDNEAAAPFHSTAATPQPGRPAILFHIPQAMTWFAPSHKPGRFIGAMRSSPEESVPVMNYVTGWAEKLEE